MTGVVVNRCGHHVCCRLWPILMAVSLLVQWVRPAGIEPATKCLEGGREVSDRQPACRLTMAIGAWLVRGGTVATGPVVVAVVVGGALGLRACPHSCQAFRRWTAVKAARAVNRRPGWESALTDGRRR